jgi:hypothetical protein
MLKDCEFTQWGDRRSGAGQGTWQEAYLGPSVWVNHSSVWAPDPNPSRLGTHREGVAAGFRGGMS